MIQTLACPILSPDFAFSQLFLYQFTALSAPLHVFVFRRKAKDELWCESTCPWEEGLGFGQGTGVSWLGFGQGKGISWLNFDQGERNQLIGFGQGRGDGEWRGLSWWSVGQGREITWLALGQGRGISRLVFSQLTGISWIGFDRGRGISWFIIFIIAGRRLGIIKLADDYACVCFNGVVITYRYPPFLVNTHRCAYMC